MTLDEIELKGPTLSYPEAANILRWLSLGCAIKLVDSRWVVAGQALCGLNVDFGESCDDDYVEWLLSRGFVGRKCDGSLLVIAERGEQFLRDTDAHLRDLIERMAPQKALDSLADLIAHARTINPPDQLSLAYYVAGVILSNTIGIEWMHRHVMGYSAPTKFFRNSRTTASDRVVHMARVIQLAEMLFNLQRVPGIRSIVHVLRTESDVEARFAELEVGKLLALYKTPFHFVTPSGTKGKDYDIEVKLNAGPVCVDVKCKLESTPEGEAALLRTLKNAASKQLPSDRPGAFFVKLPQSWNADGMQFRHFESFDRITNDLYRNSGRVVSVVFYFSLSLDFADMTAFIFAAKEIPSRQHRFAMDADWTILNGNDEILDTKNTNWVDFVRMCE